MGDRDSREGRDKEDAGKVMEGIGKAANNTELETEGRIRQAEGELQQGIGDAERDVEKAADEARDTLADR